MAVLADHDFPRLQDRASISSPPARSNCLTMHSSVWRCSFIVPVAIGDRGFVFWAFRRLSRDFFAVEFVWSKYIFSWTPFESIYILVMLNKQNRTHWCVRRKRL